MPAAISLAEASHADGSAIDDTWLRTGTSACTSTVSSTSRSNRGLLTIDGRSHYPQDIEAGRRASMVCADTSPLSRCRPATGTDDRVATGDHRRTCGRHPVLDPRPALDSRGSLQPPRVIGPEFLTRLPVRTTSGKLALTTFNTSAVAWAMRSCSDSKSADPPCRCSSRRWLAMGR